MPTSPVFPFTLTFYVASCTLYLAQIAAGAARPSPGGRSTAAQLVRAARWLLLAAFLSHGVDIGTLCARGMNPVANAREALSFVGWVTVGAYLLATWRQALPLAGALVVPVTLVLDVAARVGPAEHVAAGPATALSIMHIVLASAGIALFAVAAGAAAVYLYAEGQLKTRRLLPGGNLPALESLDRLNRTCIQLGFPLYTIAMVTGAIWLSRLPSETGGAHRLLQPQYLLATVAWGLYAGLLLLRFLVGWRGRRAALVTLGGFAASLGVLVIYYVRGVISGGS